MRLAAAFLLLPLALPGAIAETEDYLIVFAADSLPYQATRAHTFAALVRIEKAPDGTTRVVDFTSLSWLPVSMKVHAWKIWSETGRNVPLDETLRAYQATGSRICMWGPYRVGAELAETFKARVASMESQGKYQAACRFSSLQVCDCARSVEEMLGGDSRRYIGMFGYGAAASSIIVKKFSPWMVEPEHSHLWVAQFIGLDQYQIIHRPFGDFTSRKDQFRAWLQK
jgi:hypothetical protein